MIYVLQKLMEIMKNYFMLIYLINILFYFKGFYYVNLGLVVQEYGDMWQMGFQIIEGEFWLWEMVVVGGGESGGVVKSYYLFLGDVVLVWGSYRVDGRFLLVQ